MAATTVDSAQVQALKDFAKQTLSVQTNQTLTKTADIVALVWNIVQQFCAQLATATPATTAQKINLACALAETVLSLVGPTIPNQQLVTDMGVLIANVPQFVQEINTIIGAAEAVSVIAGIQPSGFFQRLFACCKCNCCCCKS